ncbi:MAG: sugar ABC transporter ATP-binding protein [Olsenella sp.]|jgi:AI-2 transport system ATP-binding protein|nr:sugar ABC transporter ATP-binding protein [Olsenella sp.]MCI1793405.1 sugar ABC transporter ATP-binding protein [Olsenella sp.]MCI1810940.1 sugar ABC transporter ATP-binding protein [Olsenella sp.]MCI1879627.1 sugar ABC transporter ATP-binding protein [Olsenella sp.]MCI2122880.1 sugar ABC transporter ATP-binding protein [Olsenella sp.]
MADTSEGVSSYEIKNALLSVRNICKAFGSNSVLKGVSLDLMPGEVIALVGGNGAGKSTLMKIIMGIYAQDCGEIYVEGRKVEHNSTREALSNSTYMVPQEPMLFPNMTVRENVEIGFAESPSGLDRRLEQTMDEIGWHFDLERKASTLSIAEQGMVEILRGIMRRSKVLILDEPTSALAFDEVKSLFKVVGSLKEKGIGIIYITHRLTEVFEIADRVSVMCDGIIAMQGKVSEFTREDLIRGLLPPDTKKREAKASPRPVSEIDYGAKPVLELQDFTGYGFSHVNLKIYPGEMVGLAGVVGAGRTEMATTIFGRDKVLGGKVLLDGKDITGESTKQVIEEGINYVSEDRFANGIFRIRDVAENTTASILNGKCLGSFFLNEGEEDKIAQSYVDNFHTKVTGLDQEVGSLSGGNQQKIIIARAFASQPRLVILDEPTRGIDAAARGDVYAVLQELRKTGVSILLISSDMEEVVELADRAVTMFQGRINHEFKKGQITQDNLMAASFGVYREGAGEKVAS